MIRFLVGDNWFLIKQALDEEIRNFLSGADNLAVERFDGNQDSEVEFIGSLSAVSLFSEERLVVVENLSKFKNAHDDINKLLVQVDEKTHLIIIERSLDKRSSYYKALKKQPGFKEFRELSETEVFTWIAKFVEGVGGQISSADVRFLVDRVGNNQTLLERELVKLLAFNKKITKSSIETLTEPTPKSTVFNLVDTAFSGNLKTAIELYEDQRKQRVEPQAIFGMLVWQMHIVALCASSAGMSSGELASVSSVNPYVLNKSKSIAAKMGPEKVKKYLAQLLDIERSSRQKTYDFDSAMKFAIASLA